jgi:thiol-disulfide isomerase/thioredoxin
MTMRVSGNLRRELLMALAIAACSQSVGANPVAAVLFPSAALLHDVHPPRVGPWRAWLESPGGELPFGIELARDGDKWTAYVINGEERINVPRVTWTGHLLVLDIDYYNSRLVAEPDHDGSGLTGEWIRQRSEGRVTRMPFHAASGKARRFEADPEAAGRPTGASSVEGRWSATFADSGYPCVAVLTNGPSDTVAGTFLTPGGDYGFLAGNMDGDRLRLSGFDGAHALLYDARLLADGTLKGDFWSRDTHHETWMARRDPHAALPDAFSQSESVNDIRLSGNQYPDLDGTPRSLNDPAFQGRARIIEIFGSWCPNCHDASKYLMELQQRYRDRGLRVLGLGFEMSGDFKTDADLVRKYAARHGVTYPMLIVGKPGKEKVAEALPGLTDLRAYPTTLFLDARNRVRATHYGFSGPATGEDYRKLRAEFEAIVEKLLSETTPDTP